ncbi:MAG: amidohydrolase family protein [Actinobacteria bacterium]|nr:amidohydrolase family protein [Actinomycetota bacterium]
MLLTARYVLPISEPFIENGAILVRDDKIVEVGHATDLKVRHPEEPVKDFGLAALMPGFIDVHTHLEYSAMRGLVHDAPYAAWKMAVAQKEPFFTSQDWDDSALLGGLEAVASGITTIADITSSGASGHAAQAIGLRGVIYREVGTMDRHMVDEAMRKAEQDIEAWRATVDSDRLSIGIAPNSLYTCNPTILDRIAEYAMDGTSVALHLAGSMEEYQFIKYGSSPFSVHNVELGAGYGIDMPPWLPTGESPVRYILNRHLLDVPNVLAIHCVHVNDADIEKLAERDVAIAYCPRCNAKLSMGVAPVSKFLTAGIRVGLGTDSPAASDSMDMIDEMRIGLLLQRAVGDKRNFLDTDQMVYMATLGGARCLRIEDKVGSLEPGKLADIIAIDLSASHQAPTHYPNSAIGHTANQDNILMTMVSGKILFDGNLCYEVDAERVQARAEEMRLKLRY